MDTQYSEKINSSQYWDQRFLADWKENNGNEQSEFFSRLAVDHLPTWFIRYIQEHQPSFCDWGCAMGNGTRTLRELLSLKNVTGVDFSEVAIEQARASYPEVQFIAADIQKNEALPVFDIIFSSNTLEHFNNPWEILGMLSRCANQFLVILLPFQEYDRHFEHFYTFDTTNIPSTVGAFHFLTHFSILNAAKYPFTYWNGQQILLIYSTYSQLAELRLPLSEFIREVEPPPAPPAPPPPADQGLTDAVNLLSETFLRKTNEIQEEWARTISLLKEQFSLSTDSLNRRLDGTECLIAENTAEKKDLSLTIQMLRSEMQAEKMETAEKLSQVDASLDFIKEQLSRGLISRLKDSLNRTPRSKH